MAALNREARTRPHLRGAEDEGFRNFMIEGFGRVSVGEGMPCVLNACLGTGPLEQLVHSAELGTPLLAFSNGFIPGWR
jgi:hypothetical protein